MATSSIPVPPVQSSRITERTCSQCGVLFKGRGRFCTPKCYHESMTTKSIYACEYCNGEYVAAPSAIKRGQRFCSRECGRLASLKAVRLEVECAQCGVLFTCDQYKINQGRGKFCSKACFRLSKNKNVSRLCGHCGKEFKVSPTRLRDGNAKFCSNECYGLAQQSRQECACGYCGAMFEAKLSSLGRGGGKFCSPDCAHKSKRGDQSPFWRGGGSKRYYGPNWYEQRKLAYERDGGVCQVCGDKPSRGKRKNAVHHIKPRRQFNGDYVAANDLSNLITLCHSCHPKADQGKIAVPVRLL